MGNIIAGIDTGFGYGIGITNNEEITIKNYIKEIPKNKALDIKKTIETIDQDNILIKFNDRYYICGDFCLANYPDTIQRLNKDRIEDEYHLIELLVILGQLDSEKEINVYLSVGLPNRAIHQIDKFRKWLTKKTYTFSYLAKFGEIEKHINIKEVACIPQSYSPIFTLPQEKMKKNILSIDIGHSSLDLMMCKQMRPIKSDDTNLYGEGCIKIYQMLRVNLIDKYKESQYKITSYTDRKLQEILESEEYYINGERQNIDDILDYCLREYADYVFFTVENNMGKYLQDVEIFIASGGLLNNQKFKQMLTSKFKEAYGLPFMINGRCQYTVAKGLFESGKLVFSEKLNGGDNTNGKHK